MTGIRALIFRLILRNKDSPCLCLSVCLPPPLSLFPWDTVCSVRPKSGVHSAITSEEWYNYSSSIFNSPPSESKPTTEDLGDAAFADNEMNERKKMWFLLISESF